MASHTPDSNDVFTDDPLCLLIPAECCLARPKSPIFMWPDEFRKIFWGLRSRCIMPWWQDSNKWPRFCLKNSPNSSTLQYLQRYCTIHWWLYLSMYVSQPLQYLSEQLPLAVIMVIKRLWVYQLTQGLIGAILHLVRRRHAVKKAEEAAQLLTWIYKICCCPPCLPLPLLLLFLPQSSSSSCETHIPCCLNVCLHESAHTHVC